MTADAFMLKDWLRIVSPRHTIEGPTDGGMNGPTTAENESPGAAIVPGAGEVAVRTPEDGHLRTLVHVIDIQ